MFDHLLDGFAALTGCDRDALAALVEQAAANHGEQATDVQQSAGQAAALSAAHRLDRIGAAERLVAAVQAVQAVQLRDLAAYNHAELADGDRTGAGGDRDPDLAYASRVAAVEVAKVCRVSVRAAGSRIEAASRAVADHPVLLGQVGSGTVALAGLRAGWRRPGCWTRHNPAPWTGWWLRTPGAGC
jgi:hypothetical protein